MNELVSIIMPTFNNCKFLEEAVNSILFQTHENIELIIINDASTDDTHKILENLSNSDNRIRYIVHKLNKGVSETLNSGIKIAKGNYIARMDSDDVSMPTRIAEQYYLMRSNENIGVTGTYGYVIDEENNKLFKMIVPIDDLAIKQKLKKSMAFISGSIMFKKSLLELSGLFDPLVPGCEDLELILRLSNITSFINIPKPLYCWRKTIKGESNISKKSQEERRFLARSVFLSKCSGSNQCSDNDLNELYRKFETHYISTTKNIKQHNKIALHHRYYITILKSGLKYGLSKKQLLPYLRKYIELPESKIFTYYLLYFSISIPVFIRLSLGVIVTTLSFNPGIKRITNADRRIELANNTTY